jgi:hypothetical protein
MIKMNDMKRNVFKTAVLLLVVLAAACKKQEIETTPLASLQVTNAVVGGKDVQFNGYTTAPVAGYAAGAFGMLTGNQELKVFTVEAPNTVYYSKPFDFVNGGVYSLFLGGLPTAVESIFIKDEIPERKDDTFGVRLINLSPNSVPVSVNLSGEANGSLVATLAYKGITDFKSISAKATETSRTFEFRNAATGVLLKSIVVAVTTLPRYHNITLVLAGDFAATTIVRTNHY